jgi:uncharacterized protein YaiL (DUF2058 family)
MAKLSLQEQMLNAGLVDKKKLKKTTKPSKKNRTLAREVKAAAEQARHELQTRDGALNQQQKAAAEQKAIAAQIRQLIEMNRIDRSRAELGYNFTHGSVVKKIYVTDSIQRELVNGRLAIVSLGESYEVVPSIVAQKIAQRDAAVVIQSNQVAADISEEDDPYADYQIPDDLMW